MRCVFVRVVVYPAFLFPVPAMDVGVCVCGVRACVLVVFSFLFFNLFWVFVCLFAVRGLLVCVPLLFLANKTPEFKDSDGLCSA